MGGKYEIPVFVQPGAHQRMEREKRGRKPTLPDSIVAGIRWDYDHGLMSPVQIARKYGLGRSLVWNIAQRLSYQGIEASKEASESISKKLSNGDR